MLSRISTTQRSRHVFVAGVIALTLVVCALEGYNLWRLRQVAIENQLTAAAQHAGSFEEHLTQTLSVVDIALTNLGGQDAIEAGLPALLRNARYLRSISQLDVAGRVVASSEPRNVNQQFDRSELRPVASGPLALLRIGPLTAGRDLYDAQRIKDGAGVPPQSFIAVQRDVLRPDGSYATMLAVINPDYFLNYYGRNLDTGVADMELYRLDGGLLLSTAQEFSPGTKLNALVMEKLAKTESGRFQEDRPGLPSRLVGYRASRHFPVVVVVQFDASKALAAWRREATATLTVVLAVLVTTVAMLLVYFRRWQRFAEERQTWVRTLTEESAERKRTEVELLRFKNVLDNTLDMIFMFEPKSLHFVYVNQGALLNTGYSREELLGMTPYQIQPLIPEPKFRQLIAPLLSREQSSLHFDSTHRRKDGTDYLIAIFLQLVTQSDGSGLFVAIVRDITERTRAEEALRESAEKLRFAVEAADLYEWEWDVPRDTLTWNRDPVRLLGQPDVRTGKYPDFRDLVHPEDRERYLAVGRHSMKTGETYSLEFRIPEPDGAVRWISTRGKVVFDSTGAPARMLGVSQEITERKSVEDKVKRLNRIYSVLSGINNAIIRVRDRQELFAEACRIAVENGQFRMAWIGLLDPNGEDVTPVAKAGFDEGYLDVIRFTARDDVPDAYEPAARALREKTPVVCNDIGTDPLMARWHKAALQRAYRSLVVFPLRMGGKITGLLALYASEKGFFDAEEMSLLTEIAGNISFSLEYIEKEARLHYLAYHDVLTGLPGRILFQDRLDQAMTYANRHAVKLAVLLMDLDNFKNINDGLGHHAGDILLQQFAARLTSNLREGDTVARLGGDEFASVLVGVASEEDASVVAQKILQLSTEPFTIDGHELFVTFSIGISFYPKDGEDAQTLLKNADAALYRAKDQGRNNFQFCSAEMNAKALQRLTLENSLRNALKQQEFLLHYQPRVDLHSGEITGMEALVRWQHPEHGLVPPGRFIPAAEDSGLIVPLGTWVLHTACAQNKAWQAAGFKPVCVAVNLSGRQFRQKDLAEVVTRILQETGLDAAYIELELTESMVMHDVEASIATLTRLKTIGVKVSIDDFGTGYSSLSYLKRFPIDFLKIDQSFVRDISTSPDNAAITKAIISMSHDLGLKVIAEGVETEMQKSFLRLHQCDEMQGYLFSRPVPANEFEMLLGNSQVK